MRRISDVAAALILLFCALTVRAQTSPSYYIKIDSSWYAVPSGRIEIDGGTNFIDAPQAVLGGLCSRTGGGLPPNGTNSLFMGSTQFVDFVYSNEAVVFHATVPPVVELFTPFRDVRCGAGVTPPQSVIDQMNQAQNSLFRNGFEQ